MTVNLRNIMSPLALAAACCAWGQTSTPKTLPYECDFASQTEFASEWTVVNNNDDYNQWEYNDWMEGADGQMGCAYCGTNSNEGNDDYLVSSPMAMPSGDSHISFYVKGVRSDACERLELLYGTTSDVASMQLVQRWDIRSNEWREKVADLQLATGGTYYFALRSTSGEEGYSTYVDNFRVAEGKAVRKPLATITKIVRPYSQCDYSAATPLGVAVQNVGTGDIAGLTISYTVNGGATVYGG